VNSLDEAMMLFNAAVARNEPSNQSFEIMINGKPYRTERAMLTYKDVVELAFPGHGPIHVFDVSFSGGIGTNKEGILDPRSGYVFIHNGTKFSAYDTSNA